MAKTAVVDCSAGALAVERLKALQTSGDTEIAHAEADGVLCDLLIKAGHSRVVEEWKKVPKWYA